MSAPKVTVVMPVYNGASYLRTAIESILHQTFEDLELLIINDGSTDESKIIINSYLDQRIRLIDNEGNRGIAYTRNRGVREAKGKFLAILDCDDIALRERIEIQYKHLMDNPDLAMTGGHAQIINTNGEPTGDYFRMPCASTEISIELLFRNVFVNSTVMFRKKAINEIGGYKFMGICEDYDLAFRINEHYPVDNLDQVLVQYRVHNLNISTQKETLMQEGEEQLVSHMHHYLGIPYEAELQMIHLSFIRSMPDLHVDLMGYFRLFEAIKLANDKGDRLPKNELNKVLLLKWYEMIRQSRSRNSLSLFLKKPLFNKAYTSPKMYRKIIKQALGWI